MNTHCTPPAGTRAALEQALRENGAEQSTIDLLCRATAGERHNARVQATIAAAQALADEHGSSLAAVLICDLAGVGGHAGVTGEGTTRMLHQLGAGRWQAADGGAYLAAAECAAWLANYNPNGVASYPGESVVTDVAVAALLPLYVGQVTTLATLVVTAMMGLRTEGHCRICIVSQGERFCVQMAENSIARIEGGVEAWILLLNAALRACVDEIAAGQEGAQ